MITGLTNLGPSLVRTPDLGAKGDKVGKIDKEISLDGLEVGEDIDVTSFQKTFDNKIFNNNRVNKSDVSTVGMPQQTQDAVSDLGSYKIENQGKEQVMLNFMDSMQSEVNIPPTRIVEAMTSLSPEDQLKAPEETASQVISQLKLDPKDQEKAMALYMSFLTQTNQLNQQAPVVAANASTMAASNPVIASHVQAPTPQEYDEYDSESGEITQSFMTSDLPETELSESSVISTQNQTKPISVKGRRQLLNESLDKMNQKFFLKDLKQASTIKGQEVEMPLNPTARSPKESGLMTAEAENEMVILNPEQLNPIQMQREIRRPSQSSMNRQQLAVRNYRDSSEVNPMPTLNVPMESYSEFNSYEEDKASSKEGDLLAKPDQTSMMPTNRSEADHFRASLKDAAVAAPIATAINHRDVERGSIQQLLESGKYLIRNGGGEASIQMNPEGLGQVHLRVAVQDGKVNVQMLTEQNETKKILENSLGELKHSLGAHNMELSTVRIDNAEPHRNGPQMDMRSDLSREQARQFLGQFREDNLDRRQGFYETPAMKSYGSNRKIDPLRPAPVETTTRRYAGAKKGSGLDLVA